MADGESVTPDDVKRVAEPTLAHRLALTPDAAVDDADKRDVIDDVLDRVAAPTVERPRRDFGRENRPTPRPAPQAVPSP